MTFTQYLRYLTAMGLAPSFRFLWEQGPWPDGSTRLEEYELVLHDHLDAGREDALLELRTLWERWSTGPASSADLDADHALCAWRDYALHLRDCELTEEGPCPRAADLLARAIAQSHFHDLALRPADPVPCEDPDDAEVRHRRNAIAAQALSLPDVEAFLRPHRRQPPPSSSTPASQQ